MKNAQTTLKTSLPEALTLVDELHDNIRKKDFLIENLEQENKRLLEELHLARATRYGKSSEALPESENQLDLFNEAELILEKEGEEDEKEDEPETAIKRKKPIRKPLPTDLPRKIIEHDIEESDKVCDCCGNDLHKIGEDKSEQLEFIPAQIKVIEHVRLKYSCRACESNAIKTNIKIAPLPKTPIPKSIATSTLLSQLITNKYQYALPLYRQESLFKQHGIELSRQTMSSWMIRSAELLTPLYDTLKTIQRQQRVIHADETPVKVVKEDKNTCYMWVYCTGTDSPSPKPAKPEIAPNIIIYDYQLSRESVHPKTYLEGFNGHLQVDGYAGYQQTDTTLVGCFAHARRKFIEAQKSQVKGKSGKADVALSAIQKLYRIEKEIQNKTNQEKFDIRQKKSKPILEKFKKWLDTSATQIIPKSALGKAISYNISQWPKLVRYIEHGYLNIDNNRAERAIKPFVIGRKNWLFSHTSNGARASAILYSIIETAKANGLIPYDYIRDCLEEVAKKPEHLEQLLPWNRP